MVDCGGLMNNKDYGNIGEAEAISFYIKKGYMVSKPLFENCKYDMVVDDGKSLLRVQVKTSRHKTEYGKYQVNLRTRGGNRSGTGQVTRISSEAVDLVFIYLEDGRIFEFTGSELEGKSTINL